LFCLILCVSATLREAISSAFSREEPRKIAGKLSLQLPTQNDKEPFFVFLSDLCGEMTSGLESFGGGSMMDRGA